MASSAKVMFRINDDRLNFVSGAELTELASAITRPLDQAPKARSIAAAVSRRPSGIRWEYLSKVVVIDRWPRCF